MELINKLRKSRKGFTLVEIIVVLVILAILAAFMIPSMLGFVGDAKKKAAIAEQREVYVAAQAIVTEHLAKEGDAALTVTTGSLGMTASGQAANLSSEAVSKLATSATSGAAYEMKNYLGNDITANKVADSTATPPVVATTADSTWTVEVGTTGNTKGQVTKVTYTKNDVKLDDLIPSRAVK